MVKGLVVSSEKKKENSRSIGGVVSWMVTLLKLSNTYEQLRIDYMIRPLMNV